MRHDGRQPDELRPLQDQAPLHARRAGQRADPGRPDHRALHGQRRPTGSAVDDRPGTRLGHGRVQHAARQHQPAQAARPRRQARRPHQRNPAADRPQPAGGDRPGRPGRADRSPSTATCWRPTAAPAPPASPGRSSPWSTRWPRSSLPDPRRRPLSRQRGGGERGHRRRPAGARPGLPRGRGRQRRHERGDDRRRPIRRSAGHRRRGHVQREGAGRSGEAGPQPASASWRPCRRRPWASIGRWRSCDPQARSGSEGVPRISLASASG